MISYSDKIIFPNLQPTFTILLVMMLSAGKTVNRLKIEQLNNIILFQDEIYIDEECDPESGRSETEDELPPPNVLPSIQEAPQPQQQALPQGQPLASYYPSAPPMPANMAVPPHHPPQLPPTVMAASAPVPAINGSVHPEDVLPAAMPSKYSLQAIICPNLTF